MTQQQQTAELEALGWALSLADLLMGLTELIGDAARADLAGEHLLPSRTQLP